MYAFANDSFYPISMRPIYEAAGSWPESYIEVDESVFAKFSETPPDGKVRGTGNDGLPVWIDIPDPTLDELIATAEFKKANLRVLADSEIFWRQDAIDEGIATEVETTTLSEWKKYRVLLMRVDTTQPVWPTPPA